MSIKRLLAVAAVVSLAASAGATTIRRLSLEQVRDRAESIFIARVVSSSVRPVAQGHLKATDYTVETTEVLYGTVPHTTTVTYVIGIDGAPSLEAGREYVFFRTAAPNNTTVGWNQGLYRIDTVRADGVDRKVLVSGDGESLVIKSGTLARRRNTTGALNAPSDTRQATNGIATNADGSPARRVRAVAPAAQELTTLATLDDLRTFVRARSSAR